MTDLQLEGPSGHFLSPHTWVWEHKASDDIPGHHGTRKTCPLGTELRGRGNRGSRGLSRPVIPHVQFPGGEEGETA